MTEPIVGRLWSTTRQRAREQASERVSECERQGVRKRENERENLLSVFYGHNMTESERASERASERSRQQESKRARERERQGVRKRERDNPLSVVCRYDTTENEFSKTRSFSILKVDQFTGGKT